MDNDPFFDVPNATRPNGQVIEIKLDPNTMSKSGPLPGWSAAGLSACGCSFEEVTDEKGTRRNEYKCPKHKDEGDWLKQPEVILYPPKPKGDPDTMSLKDNKNLEKDIESVLNCNSVDAACNTPDFVLAAMVVDVLEAYRVAAARTKEWHGKDTLSIGTSNDASTVKDWRILG